MFGVGYSHRITFVGKDLQDHQVQPVDMVNADLHQVCPDAALYLLHSLALFLGLDMNFHEGILSMSPFLDFPEFSFKLGNTRKGYLLFLFQTEDRFLFVSKRLSANRSNNRSHLC